MHTSRSTTCPSSPQYPKTYVNATTWPTLANIQVEPDLLHEDVPIEPIQPAQEPVQAPKRSGHMFQVGFYSRFFDVNTDEFFGKILLALNPFNNASVVSDKSDASPELYGFIWINATIVFLMFVSATGSNLLSQFFHAGKDQTEYHYSFELLTFSIMLFYGYTVLVPLFLYVVTAWVMYFKEKLLLTLLISIYSYTNVLWFPIAAINVVLVVFISNKKHHLVLNVLQWVLVAVTGAVSGLSIVLKVRPILLKNSMAAGDTEVARKQYRLLLFTLVAAHAGFVVLVKLLFFGVV